MKKSLIALAALAATSAFAQSSVTLSGSIEFAVTRSATGATGLGGSKGDRNNLTFAGTEDLGGGLTAGFTLQHRFRSETGQNGGYIVTAGSPVTVDSTGAVAERPLFEQTAIALNSKTLGELKVGRFSNKLAHSYDLQEDSGYGVRTTGQYGRLSGQIQYTTPDFAGFKYSYLNAHRDYNKYSVAAGDGFGAGGTLTGADHNMIAHVLAYAGGAITAEAALVSGLQGESSYQIGGTYNFGNGVKVALGQFSQSDALTLGGTDYRAMKITAVGVEYRTGPWVTALTYGKASDRVSAAVGAWSKVGAKAYYSLSPRTTLEFETANLSDSSATTDGTSAFFGVRHTF